MNIRTITGMSISTIALVLGLIFLIQGASAVAATSNDQLINQIKALQSKVSALEATSRKLQVKPPVSAAQPSEIELIKQQLDKIMQVLLINGGNVTLKSGGNLVIEANGSLLIEGKSATTIKAAGSLSLEAQNAAKLKGSSTEISAAGVTSIKGSVVKLNNGNKPIAYKGGLVKGQVPMSIAPSVSATLTINDGTATVLVPK